MEGGYIKLHRTMLNSFAMSDDFLCRLWVVLLLRANATGPRFFCKRRIEVGEVAFHAEAMAEFLQVSRSKLLRGIAELESKKQLTRKQSRKFTHLVIVNWPLYQQSKTPKCVTGDTISEQLVTQQPDNNRTTSEQLVTHRTRKRESKKERMKETNSSEPPAASERMAGIEYPVVGDKKKPTWGLPQSLVDALTEAYPGTDILDLCRKAKAWCVANPGKRKTARGMPAFLNRWVDNNTNRVSAPRGSPPPQKSRTQATLERYRGDSDAETNDDSQYDCGALRIVGPSD